MLEEWSLEDDSLLFKDRLALLDTPPGGLKLKTDGYEFLKQNLKAGRILKVSPGNRYTVSEDPEFLLGKVDNLWIVGSRSNTDSATSLKQLGKARLPERKLPTSDSFDEYKKLRQSCWILEERNGDFYCDCPLGMKGKLCRHSVGLLYKTERLIVTSEVRSKELGKKRKRGRPKKLPN